MPLGLAVDDLVLCRRAAARQQLSLQTKSEPWLFANALHRRNRCCEATSVHSRHEPLPMLAARTGDSPELFSGLDVRVRALPCSPVLAASQLLAARMLVRLAVSAGGRQKCRVLRAAFWR